MEKSGFQEEKSSIFCNEESRIIKENYTIKWKKRIFKINNPKDQLKKQRVHIIPHENGNISIKLNDMWLNFSEIDSPHPVIPSKKENVILKKSSQKPSANHPWRRFNFSKRGLNRFSKHSHVF